MNYASLIKYIKDVAINNPLVKETIDGDIYQINSKENQYGVFCVTSDVITRNDHTTTYNFILFYVDRLLEDQSNKNVVQTDGVICIQSVCNFINQNNENINISTPINYQLFTQRFTDQCAGVWATINMEVEDSLGDCDLFYEGLLLDPTGATSGTSILDNYYTKAEVEELIRNATHDADMVDYDNSKTGLDATTAQDAIDQLHGIIGINTEDIENKADKANTLGGYGIEDAYTKTEIDTKLNNNRTYKILNTTVSTWSDSTTYSDYKYEAIVNINNLKESDSVEVIYNIIDAGSSNYAPGGELYEGYIKIFAKVNTTITIPTLVITKIDL